MFYQQLYIKQQREWLENNKHTLPSALIQQKQRELTQLELSQPQQNVLPTTAYQGYR